MGYPNKIGIYIGRFQPVHAGHLKSIATALEDCEKLIIFVGSTNRATTIKNPFPADLRIEFLKKAIKEWVGEKDPEGWTDYPPKSILDRIVFIKARDYFYNNYKWVSEVALLAEQHGATQNDGKTVIYGHFKDDTSFYLRMFPFWTLRTLPSFYNGLSSTNIREELFEKGTFSQGVPPCLHKDLLQAIEAPGKFLRDEWYYYRDYKKAWSQAPYQPVFVTTDSLVIRSGCILLIKRGFHPGKGLWALPGGFLEPSETIQESAIRELKEETSIAVPVEDLLKGIKQVKVFDHPKRSLRGRTITHAFEIDLGYGPLPQIKAKSDASGAHWVPISSLQNLEDTFFEDHFDIIFNLISKY